MSALFLACVTTVLVPLTGPRVHLAEANPFHVVDLDKNLTAVYRGPANPNRPDGALPSLIVTARPDDRPSKTTATSYRKAYDDHGLEDHTDGASLPIYTLDCWPDGPAPPCSREIEISPGDPVEVASHNQQGVAAGLSDKARPPDQGHASEKIDQSPMILNSYYDPFSYQQQLQRELGSARSSPHVAPTRKFPAKTTRTRATTATTFLARNYSSSSINDNQTVRRPSSSSISFGMPSELNGGPLYFR